MKGWEFLKVIRTAKVTGSSAITSSLVRECLELKSITAAVSATKLANV